ncbi:MAG: hypothetical protein ABW212_17320 [Pseudonocardia sediminis]
MSTNRRRPTTGPRRPQVAGRPRPAGTSGPGESTEAAESALAVDERTGVRTSSARTREDRPASPSTAPSAGTTTREPSAVPSGEGAPAGPASSSVDTSTDDASTADASIADTSTADTDTDESSAGTGPAEPPRAAPVGGGHDDGTPAESRGARRRIPMPSAPTTRRGTALLLAVTVLLSAAAIFFAVSFFGMRFTGAATNTALSDVGATAAVSEQIGEAATKVYSFDFARLDQAEADARAGITGPFDQQFDQIFANVRQLAPQQQAVVTATVPKSAVASITGDTATVYLFVNQVITRVDDTGKKVQGGAAARLRVDAQNVDGRWKIAGLSPA